MIELAQGSDLSYSQYCYNSWGWWAASQGIDLLILKKPIIDPSLMPATWQRYWLFELLSQNNLEYEQIAMIDIDTMVRWDCPNFFELTEGRYTSVLDRCSVGWVARAISGYKDLFPKVDLEWWDFFFAGFMIVNNTHRSFFQRVVRFFWDHFLEVSQKSLTLKKGTDITPINYLVKQADISTRFLTPNYHLCSLQQKNILADHSFIDLAYSWHFNGFPKTNRQQVMCATWNEIKSKYYPQNSQIPYPVIELSPSGIISRDQEMAYIQIARERSPMLEYPPQKSRHQTFIDRFRWYRKTQ